MKMPLERVLVDRNEYWESELIMLDELQLIASGHICHLQRIEGHMCIHQDLGCVGN